jgi:hypothetical protein
VDSSRLIVVPGFGVTNVVEIGMSMKDVATSNVKLIREKSGPNGTVWKTRMPSLGVVWEQVDDKAPVSVISFIVSSQYINSSPDLEGLSRFRGTLKGGLSFEGDGNVRKEDVIKCYGEPKHSFGEMSTSAKEAFDARRKWVELGESYTYRVSSSSGAEVLNYPGVSITLHGNRVVAIHVYAAPKGGRRLPVHLIPVPAAP